MPSGKVHRIATVTVAPLATAAAGYAASTLGQQTGWPDGFKAGSACLLGVLATLAVNPDLDLLETSIQSKLRHKRHLLFWWLMWYPYSVGIPHRHPYSHWPILGTMLRWVYVLAVISLLAGVLVVTDFITPEYVFANTPPRWFLLWMFSGMVISDTFHWFLDVTT